MKLISLNTYGGIFFKPLLDFIEREALDTDVFCFQEVLGGPNSAPLQNSARANLFSELARALPGFTGFFAPVEDALVFSDNSSPPTPAVPFGTAIFVHKKHTIHQQGSFFIYRERNAFVPRDFTTLGHNAIFVQLVNNGKLLTICNVHGTSEPGDKLDTPDRLAQSQTVLDFIKKQSGEKIIAGDFNLLPATQSIALFERAGFSNLIKDFSIASTRGSILKTIHPEYGDTPNGWQEFADYVFTSAGITPQKFSVPDIAIADHLPLILEFVD